MNTLHNHQVEIQQLVGEKVKNTVDGDKDALLSHYKDDVMIYDLGQSLEFQGKDSLDQRLTAWFKSYKGEIKQEIKNLQVEASTEVAISHCLMRTYGVGTDGTERDMWYRITSGYKRVGEKWLIFHEHISEPIDFSTGKGMFDLVP